LNSFGRVLSMEALRTILRWRCPELAINILDASTVYGVLIALSLWEGNYIADSPKAARRAARE